jgi:hypothetical protein
MIATTSSPELLECRQVRRDQIRIVQEKPDGSSTVYSLPEIADCNAASAPGQLQGLYGPIPYAGDPQRLFDGDVAWQRPAIHDKIVGRTPEGKKFWTRRKRFKLAWCFLKRSFRTGVPDEERVKQMQAEARYFRALFAR